jgi:mono/diheme cytochrome c family protein
MELINVIKPFLLALLFTAGSGCAPDTKANQKETVAKADERATENPAQPTSQTAPEIGVGPFKSVDLSKEPDMALAEKGKILFDGRCTACHKFEERFVGPPLAGVTEKRNPVWIMNMIINPNEMVQKDPIAKKLLEEYLTPMVNMHVNEDDTRAILEYMRAHDMGKMD